MTERDTIPSPHFPEENDDFLTIFMEVSRYLPHHTFEQIRERWTLIMEERAKYPKTWHLNRI